MRTRLLAEGKTTMAKLQKVSEYLIFRFHCETNTFEFLAEFWNLLARLNVYQQQITARYDFYEILQLEREDSVEKIEKTFQMLTSDPNCE